MPQALTGAALEFEGGPAGAGQAMACPKGGPVGVCSLGYFSCTSKKSDSPACTGACLKGETSRRAKKGSNGS